MHRAGRDVGYFFLNDALVSPVVATPPPVLGTLDTSSNDVDAYLQAVFNFIPFTAISNQAGIPSMSVPLHWNDQNVPIGVHFMAGTAKTISCCSLHLSSKRLNYGALGDLN